MTTETSLPHDIGRLSWSRAGLRVAPGLALCAAAAGLAIAVSRLLPGISPLALGIVLGIVVTNVTSLPASLWPGITLSAKKLLRLGIVLLGLQLALADIVALGVPMLAVVGCVVGGGIVGTVALGRVLGVPPGLTVLIACGFSICGAAAVAGVQRSTSADDEDVVTAVALVVVFGTAALFLVPALGPTLGLTPQMNALWAGASIHEIAQVVAAGGLIGGGALAVAVVVKLARVLMLAPVVAVLSLHRRLRTAADPAGQRPAVLPLFVVGFLGMVLLRSAVDLPASLLAVSHLLQTAVLTAAMFGLGCGVQARRLLRVGPRPFVLAAASTLWVAAIALVGVHLVRVLG